MSVCKGWWAGLLTALVVSAALAEGEERLAACAGCHGPDGNSRTPRVPSIAGQPKVFLENYLVLAREGLRGSENMHELLHGVADREIVALAAHYSKLPMKIVRPIRQRSSAAVGLRQRIAAATATVRTSSGRNRCRGSRASAKTS